jgi:hypothetical protein
LRAVVRSQCSHKLCLLLYTGTGDTTPAKRPNPRTEIKPKAVTSRERLCTERLELPNHTASLCTPWEENDQGSANMVTPPIILISSAQTHTQAVPTRTHVRAETLTPNLKSSQGNNVITQTDTALPISRFQIIPYFAHQHYKIAPPVASRHRSRLGRASGAG